jgi:hypothetical protein
MFHLIFSSLSLADTYCPLFYKENGHILLKELIENDNLDIRIRNYANIVLTNVVNCGLKI